RFTFLNTVMMVRSGPIRTLRLLDYLVSGRRPTAPAEPEPPPATYEALDYDSILRAGNRWYDRVVASLRIPDRTRREQAFAELEQELLRLKQEAGSLASVLDALRGG